MLIIEGADGLGKTTACKRLVELATERAKALVPTAQGNWREFRKYAYPVRYQHMSRPNVGFDFFNDYLDMMSRYAVQDRFHLGGVVWHEGEINPHQMRVIEGRLACLGSMLIVFVTSDVEWYANWLTDNAKQEMFAPDKILAANQRYLTIQETGSNPDRFYDVGAGEFPGDETLNFWLDEWFNRMRCLPR